MDSVYLGSQLTIAVAQSADTFGGCFPLNSQSDGVHQGEMFFKTPVLCDPTDEQILVRVYHHDIWQRVKNTPLSGRGWTLQEQLLSHRIAWCMQPEVHWSCQASYQSQSGLYFAPDEVARAQSTLPLLMDATFTFTSRDWHRIVGIYSRRGLTFPRDRVAAMAGITRYIAGRVQARPILGLWEETFSRDLAWLRASPDPKPELPSLAALLPSWSWLACPGSVYYDPWDWNRRLIPASDPVDHVRLLEWEVTWDGNPYTSAVTSAYARVDGPVREIHIRSFPEGAWGRPPYLQVFGEDVKFGGSTGGEEPKTVPRRCCGQFDAVNAAEIEPRSFLCLLVRLRMGLTLTGGFYCDEIFLILDSVSGGGGGGSDPQQRKYRRVGLARIVTGDRARTFDTVKSVSLLLV
ncbi:hypothetical protein B0T25DRAFT_135604 [Lasiosphaeria hispida]|uniref:Heterokaryon incompatibility domain-containing protein n=1 Tax=Lasiosphaeria hispida TaxID=260671 RepID=A0AAJ0HKC5_9PEZI|nr:hypothetical protein B0T25DRAFT_135604 [Lasiosphaeria hispida]